MTLVPTAPEPESFQTKLDSGDIAWLTKDRVFHRLDGPALIRTDGVEAWYYRGQYHRKDGPALRDFRGCQEWYQYGELHRANGPAALYETGEVLWFFGGKQIFTKKDYQARTDWTDAELDALVDKYGGLE